MPPSALDILSIVRALEVGPPRCRCSSTERRRLPFPCQRTGPSKGACCTLSCTVLLWSYFTFSVRSDFFSVSVPTHLQNEAVRCNESRRIWCRRKNRKKRSPSNCRSFLHISRERSSLPKPITRSRKPMSSIRDASLCFLHSKSSSHIIGICLRM